MLGHLFIGLHWRVCLAAFLRQVYHAAVYTNFDLMLMKSRMMRKYLWWPLIFGADDCGVSQNAGPHGDCVSMLRGEPALGEIVVRDFEVRKTIIVQCFVLS